VADQPDYTRQPAPVLVEGAVSAHDLVTSDLREWAWPDCTEAAEAELAERKAYGLDKYGTVLHVDNGRDHLRDALDEALDLSVYLRMILESDMPVQDRALVMEYYRWTLWMLAQLARMNIGIPPMHHLRRVQGSGLSFGEPLHPSDTGAVFVVEGHEYIEDATLCGGLQIDGGRCIMPVGADLTCARHGKRKHP
jgi:hypothetical protein